MTAHGHLVSYICGIVRRRTLLRDAANRSPNQKDKGLLNWGTKGIGKRNWVHLRMYLKAYHQLPCLIRENRIDDKSDSKKKSLLCHIISALAERTELRKYYLGISVCQCHGNAGKCITDGNFSNYRRCHYLIVD